MIAETVATPIEQEVNGVEDMLYMSSQSTSDGSMTLTITFKLEPISIRRRCSSRAALPSRCPDCLKRSAALV